MVPSDIYHVQYAHENTLAFGYGGELFNESNGEPLQFRLARCEREPLPFPEECARTAALLGEKAKRLGRPVYLMQSGGLDSEVMINSFRQAQVPFQTISFEFTGGLNTHETAFIKRFSARHELNTVMYQLDIVEWLKTQEAREYFALSNCWEAAMLPHMKLMHHVWFELGGMPVLGGGDTVIMKYADGWRFCKYEYILAWYWFMAKHGIDGGVAFFQHTPELMLSMLCEPLIERAARGLDQTANKVLKDLRAVKYRVYHKHWPDLERRIKFGGTEMIHGLVAAFEQRVRAKRFDSVWSIPYEDAVKALSPLPSAVPADA